MNAPLPREVWNSLLAHDLKNALGLLEADLEHLAAEPDPGDARRAHHRCREVRQRLVMMLTVAGSGDGRPDALPAWPTDESPADFLHAVARGALALRPDVRLSVTIAPGTPPFWTFDVHLVRLALDAALHNAMRFARHRIELRAALREGGLRLAVLDDGPGPGGQPVADISGFARRSTGLGMTLCRAVASAHHCGGRPGSADLHAGGLPAAPGQPPAVGATFELWLP
jgi:signal transduction histidine kinase